jgi:hypothetical protein
LLDVIGIVTRHMTSQIPNRDAATLGMNPKASPLLRRPPVPTENSIALKKREQHSRGNEFLGLRKYLSNRRVLNDPPYRLPEQRFTAAGSVHILKRKRLLKLPVVRIDGEVLPPAAVQ